MRFRRDWSRNWTATNSHFISLTFHLTGLRPGKLRIIANFGPHPHQVSHTYTRRNPQESDIVVEIDLAQSISDLIVSPDVQKKPDAVDMSR